MKYALVELHSESYQPLADLTWNQNKLIYAEKHGYKVFCKTDNFREGSGIGYQKIWYLKELLKDNPDIEWFWWTGTDTLITNYSTRIQDRISNAYHFMICVDVNGINADSFFVRNTPEGCGFIDDILSLEEEASKHWDVEHYSITKLLGFPKTGDPSWPRGDDVKVADKYKNIVKLLPQRCMNSFNYLLYHYKDQRDKLNFDGNWQLGDWLIHWPATTLEYRLELVDFYKNYIVK
jgi:hypothetical protein